jgi:hypothetical protein
LDSGVVMATTRIAALPVAAGFHAVMGGRPLLAGGANNLLLAVGLSDGHGSAVLLELDSEGGLRKRARADGSALPENAAAAAVSADGAFAAVSADSAGATDVALYSMPDLAFVANLTRPPLPARAIAFSPDGALV